jgi:diguanylate cyclase (GGDEF)-like protein/PAS domain S-box-containing protein
MLATLSVDLINQGGNAAYFIWVANGLLLSYLLLAPRWRWPAYLGAGAAAHLFATLLIWGTWDPAQLIYTTLDISEVLAAALLLRRRSAQLPRFTHRAYLFRFLGYAVVACPAVTGLIYTLFAVVCQQARPVSAFLSWAAVNALGTAVVTPACVAIFQTRFRSTANAGRYWLYLVLFVAAILAVFTQNSVTLLDFIYPILVLILLAMGLGWAALATLFVAAAGGWFSMRGIGPLAITSVPNPGSAPIVRMQMLVASAMLMLYTISIVLEKQRSTERRLRNIVAQRDLVTENSRDVIILSDLDDHRSYVSPAAESLLGWKPEEMIKQGCTEMVHPDDLVAMQASLRQLWSKPEESVAEYRFRKANGEYVWVEANLRMIRDPETGVRSGILNMMRGINDRKRAELQLEDAFHAVQTLAVKDALTGLANRRRFDECLNAEWRRCQRERKPLSMLMIDADWFKLYNDSYGHVSGDECLKQIADAALSVVTRPGDLVARCGGEEFAVILPNTGNRGAMQVANEISEAVRNRKIGHAASSFGVVTISVGCATVIPRFGQHALELVRLADEALYKAKRMGRNHVCNANIMGRSGVV